MPDEDERFGDVAEQLKQTESSGDEEKREPEEETTTVAEPPGDVEGKTPSLQEQPEPDEVDKSEAPAFSFDETDMHGFYVRGETWNRVKRMRSLVTAACSMFDVPEFEGREFHDACLQIVADHGDEVALKILREREIEADEQRVEEVVEMLSDQASQ